jgi:hypothetical protein
LNEFCILGEDRVKERGITGGTDDQLVDSHVRSEVFEDETGYENGKKKNGRREKKNLSLQMRFPFVIRSRRFLKIRK